MAKVKYTLETVYLADLESWNELEGRPRSVAEEMYNDLPFANSGALMLSQHLSALVSDTRSNSVTFLYPEVDKDTVSRELYWLLRDGSKEGVSFKETFRYTIKNVKPENEDEDLIGLEIKFIK